MSEGVGHEPESVHSDKDDKKSIVDIYVSAESLRVYENPWVESMSPNVPGLAGGQHTVSLVIKNPEKRNHVRGDSAFLSVSLLCLLLLVGIIWLGVHMKKEKNNWEQERKQLQAEKEDLGKENVQLTANNTELRKERDGLWKRFCEKNPNSHGQEKPCEALRISF